MKVSNDESFRAWLVREYELHRRDSNSDGWLFYFVPFGAVVLILAMALIWFSLKKPEGGSGAIFHTMTLRYEAVRVGIWVVAGVALLFSGIALLTGSVLLRLRERFFRWLTITRVPKLFLSEEDRHLFMTFMRVERLAVRRKSLPAFLVIGGSALAFSLLVFFPPEGLIPSALEALVQPPWRTVFFLLVLLGAASIGVGYALVSTARVARRHKSNREAISTLMKWRGIGIVSLIVVVGVFLRILIPFSAVLAGVGGEAILGQFSEREVARIQNEILEINPGASEGVERLLGVAQENIHLMFSAEWTKDPDLLREVDQFILAAFVMVGAFFVLVPLLYATPKLCLYGILNLGLAVLGDWLFGVTTGWVFPVRDWVPFGIVGLLLVGLNASSQSAFDELIWGPLSKGLRKVKES